MKTLTALITVLALSPFSVAAVDSTSDIADDRRVAIDRTSEKFKQLNAIGLVTHTKQEFLGTGFLVSSCVMLTNHHVAFDDPDKEVPEAGKTLYFSAGQTGLKSNPFKCSKVEGKVIDFNKRYKNAISTTGYDWALVKVDKVRDENGKMANLGDKVGFIEIYQASTSELVEMNGLVTAGFPSDKTKYDKSYIYGDTDCRVKHSSGTGQVVHSCQTSHGQSGSPILAQADDGVYYAVSMVSASIRSFSKYENNKNIPEVSVIFDTVADSILSDGDRIVNKIKSIKCD